MPTLLETITPVTASPQRGPPRVRNGMPWLMIRYMPPRRRVSGLPAVGTDAGLSPDHGTNLKELALLVKFGGLTPMQAIVAGTLTSAELCGVADELGSIESGKRADVVVRGNPVDDIDAVGNPENILLVIKDGRVAGNRGAFGGLTAVTAPPNPALRKMVPGQRTARGVAARRPVAPRVVPVGSRVGGLRGDGGVLGDRRRADGQAHHRYRRRPDAHGVVRAGHLRVGVAGRRPWWAGRCRGSRRSATGRWPRRWRSWSRSWPASSAAPVPASS